MKVKEVQLLCDGGTCSLYHHTYASSLLGGPGPQCPFSVDQSNHRIKFAHQSRASRVARIIGAGKRDASSSLPTTLDDLMNIEPMSCHHDQGVHLLFQLQSRYYCDIYRDWNSTTSWMVWIWLRVKKNKTNKHIGRPQR